jgi:hypothetical protein
MYRPAPTHREARHSKRHALSPYFLEDVTFTRSEIMRERSETIGVSNCQQWAYRP